jgi:hypothetical protein
MKNDFDAFIKGVMSQTQEQPKAPELEGLDELFEAIFGPPPKITVIDVEFERCEDCGAERLTITKRNL